MTNVLEQQRVKPEKFNSLFEKLQANILSPDGRDNVALMLLNFLDGKEKQVKKILSGLSITSTAEQIKSSAESKLKIARGEGGDYSDAPLINLYLSCKGYHFLKMKNVPDDRAFRDGMANRNLGDPAIEHWELPYRSDIHAMIRISHDNNAKLANKVDEIKKLAKGIFNIVQIQLGTKLINNQGETIEHFGYIDGISQPLFLEKDFLKNRTPIKSDEWDPAASLSLVLVKDPGGDSEDCFGSYLVYRKLEQNVKAFKEAEEILAKELGFEGETKEVAGAMIIGRFENGLPILKFGSVTSPEEVNKENNFNYSTDSEGTRCPFHAHIRKSNPRGDAQRAFGMSEEEERSHRIARRGITYDDIGRNGNLNMQPEGGVGLLFQCFQSNIENQFEFIQRFWVNNNDFPKPFTGIDPVIGQGENRINAEGKDAEQKWKGIDYAIKAKSIASFVTMMGGEYFFAPSLPTIKKL